ncbi:hypothetical protein H4582DRAFT_1900503 [Lactarius indigo]|nr:hypothetical protein H4582DRAFT_1900503 [Lactarius indigo]
MRTFTAFDLAHPARPTPSVSPPRSLEWHMVFQPFKVIANRLAHFLSCLRLPNPLGRIRISLWNFLQQDWGAIGITSPWPKSKNGGTSQHEHERLSLRAPMPATGRVGGAHGCISPVPLITYYVPRLLPAYRDHSSRRVDDAASERELTPSVYQKWHRLVYPHETPPLRREAAKIIRYLSTRDRQEITRMARLVTDEAAAQKGFSPSPAYQDLWASWLQCKALI